MKPSQLPTPVLSAMLAAKALYPSLGYEAHWDGSVDLAIPARPNHPPTMARIYQGDLDADGQRAVWLVMDGLPFGRCRIVGARACALKIKAVIDGCDDAPRPLPPLPILKTGGER